MRVIDREVSNEQMRALLSEVDVTLFPSRFEGVGYPVLESLHAGVPVIATDAAPMNEIVEDERNGLLVRARDAGHYGAQTIRDVEPEHLRAQIERCATDRALLDRLKAGATAGRAEAAEAFRARRGSELIGEARCALVRLSRAARARAARTARPRSCGGAGASGAIARG